MTQDQERWAEALAVERMHGEQAAVFIAERIVTLGAAGDPAGVARWTEIADRLVQLQGASSCLLTGLRSVSRSASTVKSDS